ncbi:MAG: hypothetical protein AB7J35_11985 [Dehalococcoidia bacterium]
MTKLAAEAWAKLQELDDADQDRLARIVLDDIESERRWDKLFAESEEALETLGDEAWDQHKKGRTTALDPNNA